MGLINWALNLGNSTLYFPGCFTRHEAKDVEKNYEEIFNILSIRFKKLPEISCCGSTIYNLGYKKEAKKLFKKNHEILLKNGIRKIITDSPEAYYFFKEVYPLVLKDWDIEVEHVSVAILKSITNENIFSQSETVDLVTYHDPFYLGRYSNLFEEPRKVIAQLGSRIQEFEKTKEKTQDICSETSYYINYPEISKESAILRAAQTPKDATKIITPCAITASLLKQADPRAIEFSTFVLEKLKEIMK